MPRHATEKSARVTAGLTPGTSNRLASEQFVTSLFGVGTATPGKLATETFILSTKALLNPPQVTSFSWFNEGANLLTEWSAITDTAAQLTQSTVAGAVHEGTKGIKITGNTGTGSPVPAYVTKQISLPGTGWKVDFWLGVGGSLTLSQTYHDITLAKVADDSGDIMRVFLTGARQLRVERAVPSYLRFASDVGTIANNTWTKMSLELTGGGTSAGTMTVYINDVSVASATGLVLSRYKITQLMLGMIGFSATTVAGSIYIDNGTITATGVPATPTTAVGVPQNVVSVANSDQSVTTTWDAVPDFDPTQDHYEVFEAATTSGPVAPLITTTSRTSGRLNVGNYSYTVVAVVNGVRSVPSDPALVTVGATATPPSTGTPVLDSALQSSFRTAKDTYNSTTIYTWFNDNVLVRGTFSGTHPGGTITTQSAADAMAGKTVVGDCYLGGTLTLDNVCWLGRRLEISAGAVITMTNCLVDGANQTFDADHFTQRGKLTMTRCEVRRAQDGFKTFVNSDVTLRYVYIHEPCLSTGGLTGNATHQDGIQVMGGKFDALYCGIDYQGNHDGGQGFITKSDSGDIGSWRFADSIMRAGGNNFTFEPTSLGSPDSIDLGTGASRNVIAPGSNMNNVLSLYEPNGAMPSTPRAQLLGSSFFIANKGGTVKTYANGINKAAIS